MVKVKGMLVLVKRREYVGDDECAGDEERATDGCACVREWADFSPHEPVNMTQKDSYDLKKSFFYHKQLAAIFRGKTALL